MAALARSLSQEGSDVIVGSFTENRPFLWLGGNSKPCTLLFGGLGTGWIFPSLKGVVSLGRRFHPDHFVTRQPRLEGDRRISLRPLST